MIWLLGSCPRSHAGNANRIPEPSSTQGDGFYCGVKLEEVSFIRLSRERIYSGILPNIGPIPAILAEFNIIAMRSFSTLKNENQFMLAPIQGSHPSVVFYPNTHKFLLGQPVIVPSGDFGQMVIGDDESADLMSRQMLDRDNRNLRHADTLSGQDAAVTSDNSPICVRPRSGRSRSFRKLAA